MIETSGSRTIFVTLTALVAFIISLKLIDSIILPYPGPKNYSLSTLNGVAKFTPKDSVVSPQQVTIQKKSADKIPAGKTVLLPKSNLTLNQNPKLLTWMLLYSVTVAISIAFAIIFIGIVLRTIKTFKLSKKSVLLNFLLFVFLVVAIALTSGGRGTDNLLSAFGIIDEFDILFRDPSILVKMLRVMIVSGSIALYGILMINTAIGTLPLKASEPNVTSLFLILRESMRILLSSLSIIIMFSVMTTAMLQQTIEAVLHIDGFVIFPSDFVYAYGLIFTIFLASLYIPVYYRLRIIGLKIFDQADKETLEMLQLKETPGRNLQPILSIFAPLLGSVFSELVKHISI